ncbi:uncharacterized protein LOC131254154 [Magnolia sinica]|uniref:uncharacterized protein LOC131254154 n=1 Tax=Magnolia sinica TaxID=86752 RepID=UPI0026588F48|nr:uncharacterized protein LOC131254154 [Magnolia sinica]
MVAAVEAINQTPCGSTPRSAVGNNIDVFERFQKMRPPTFFGTTDPMVAEHWLKCMLKLMEPLECMDAQKVTLATFALEGEADEWWDSTRRIAGGEYLWTWERFHTKFNEKYFSKSFHDEKGSQVFKLEQGSMMVAQYEARFTELSWYVPTIVNEEKVVDKATLVEKDIDQTMKAQTPFRDSSSRVRPTPPPPSHAMADRQVRTYAM